MVWAAFWATFLQTHLVTLFAAQVKPGTRPEKPPSCADNNNNNKKKTIRNVLGETKFQISEFC
jgi:hypothetical protein